MKAMAVAHWIRCRRWCSERRLCRAAPNRAAADAHHGRALLDGGAKSSLMPIDSVSTPGCRWPGHRTARASPVKPARRAAGLHAAPGSPSARAAAGAARVAIGPRARDCRRRAAVLAGFVVDIDLDQHVQRRQVGRPMPGQQRYELGAVHGLHPVEVAAASRPCWTAGGRSGAIQPSDQRVDLGEPPARSSRRCRCPAHGPRSSLGSSTQPARRAGRSAWWPRYQYVAGRRSRACGEHVRHRRWTWCRPALGLYCRSGTSGLIDSVANWTPRRERRTAGSQPSLGGEQAWISPNCWLFGQEQGFGLASVRRLAADDPRRWRRPPHQHPGAGPQAGACAGLRHHVGQAAPRLRGIPRDRLLLRDPGPGAFPRQCVQPEPRRRRGVPYHSLRSADAGRPGLRRASSRN